MVGTSHGDASIVVLAKDLGVAKTRLGLDRQHAEQLALHLALKTVRAAMEAELSGSVFVVTSDPRISQGTARLGAIVIPEGRPRGMNRAAVLGRANALRERPLVPVAVMVADLPLVRSHELDAVVARFLEGEAPLFVPDHRMTGTTLLMHSHRRWPGAAFGPQSALMHRRLGYLPMHAPRGLRIDLDVPEDAETLMPGNWSTDSNMDATHLQRLLRSSAGQESGHARPQAPSGLRRDVRPPRRRQSIGGSAGERPGSRSLTASPVKEI